MTDSDEDDKQQALLSEPNDGPAFICPGPCCRVINAGSVGVVQMCGDYAGYQNPGCAFYWPCIHNITEVSLAVQQMISITECKTKDNVSVTVKTAVQYRIDKNKLKVAFFDVADAEGQISAFIDDVLRSTLPMMDLEQVYTAKEKVRGNILHSIKSSMAQYGYLIINVLITDLSPEASVVAALNAINAAKREREAAIEKGEAQKVLMVKAAEADAEAKYLSGVGVARMRKAIADGFKESMVSMSAGGLQPSEAMHMMITTQYLDTLKDFAANPANSTVMLPCGPGAVRDIEQQVRDGFIAAGQVQRAPMQTAMVQPVMR